MNNATLINQNSLNTQWYTPPEIIAFARKIMGSITLDPCSDEIGNETVGASEYFGEPEWVGSGRMSWDSLPVLEHEYESYAVSKTWHTDVLWMNHPFGSGAIRCVDGCKKESCRKRGFHIDHYIPGNAFWVNKWADASCVHKMMICYASTSEAWFKPLKEAFPILFLDGRTKYLDSAGRVVGASTKGSCLVYSGDNWQAFCELGKELGDVMVPSLWLDY